MEKPRVSTKLLFGVATSLGIAVLGIVAAFVPLFGPYLGTVVSGVLGSFAIMSAGNVGATYAHGKAEAAKPDEAGKPEEAD